MRNPRTTRRTDIIPVRVLATLVAFTFLASPAFSGSVFNPRTLISETLVGPLSAGPSLGFDLPHTAHIGGYAPRPMNTSSVNVGSQPSYSITDTHTGVTYVLNYGSADVTVLNGSSVLANISVGSNPVYALFDNRSSIVYVINEGSDNISLIKGMSLVGTLRVGLSPDFATMDPASGEIYITNSGGNNVSLVNGTIAAGVVAVGANPAFSVYDPQSGWIYVSNGGSNNLTAINGTKVVGNIAVGQGPNRLVFDRANGFIYVSNSGTTVTPSTVSVIRGTTLVATVGVGVNPSSIIYDSATASVYVVNYGSNNVSLINGSRAIGQFQVGSSPVAAAFDPGNSLVYVVNSVSDNVSVLSGPSVAGSIVVGSHPSSVSYDDWSGAISVTNLLSNNLTVIHLGYRLSFNETGLPVSTEWWVNISGGPSTPTLSTNLSFAHAFGALPYSIGSADKRFEVPVGKATFNASNLVWTINFVQALFAVEFTAQGLPPNQPWSVTFAGSTIARAGSSITFAAANGTYQFTVGYVPGWTTANSSGAVLVNGVRVVTNISWLQFTSSVTFAEQGLPAGTGWWVNVTGRSAAYSTNQSLVLAEPNGSYSYSVSSSNRSYSSTSGGYSLVGLPVTEPVVFSLVTYGVQFFGAGLPNGAHWFVTMGGTDLTSSGSTILFREPNGTYSFVITQVASYSPSPPTGNLTVDGANVSQTIVFTRLPQQLFTVVFAELGLTKGTTWEVALNGMARTGPSTLAFTGLSNGSYPFTIGSIAGMAASPSFGSIYVDGANQSKTIVFSPVPTSPAIFLGLPATEGYSILVVAIAVIAVAIAVFAVRVRRVGSRNSRAQSPHGQPVDSGTGGSDANQGDGPTTDR